MPDPHDDRPDEPSDPEPETPPEPEPETPPEPEPETPPEPEPETPPEPEPETPPEPEPDDPPEEIEQTVTVKLMDGGELIGTMELYYGKSLKAITPPVKMGYNFTGYYSGGNRYYDGAGVPADKGKEPVTVYELVLYAGWEAKNYVLHYGLDADNDGVPDDRMSVTYEVVYPDAGIPVLQKDEIFDGYFLSGDMVFDENGRSLGIWSWDIDDPILELKSHVKKKAPSNEDPDGKEGDQPEDPNEKNGEEDGDDGSENDNDENGHQNDDGDAAGGDNDDGSVSNNSVSGNDAGGSSSENSVSNNSSGSADRSGSGRAGKKKTVKVDNPGTEDVDLSVGAFNDYMQETSVSDENAEITVAPPVTEVSGGLFDMPEIMAGSDEVYGGILDKKRPKQETGSVLTYVQKVAKAGAVTVGGIGSILVVYAGMVYLLAMAEVDTIRPDGSRKRLCKLSIHSEKGKAFMIRLNSRLQERCETDRLCLKLPLLFAMRYKDHTILVQSRGKLQERRIGREIFVSI